MLASSTVSLSLAVPSHVLVHHATDCAADRPSTEQESYSGLVLLLTERIKIGSVSGHIRKFHRRAQGSVIQLSYVACSHRSERSVHSARSSVRLLHPQ